MSIPCHLFTFEATSKPGDQYEFSLYANTLFQDLAGKMRLTALVLLGLSLAGLAAGAVTFMQGGAGTVISALINLPIALWTLRAAAGFRLIVETQGKDISHLLRALDYLRRMYSFVVYLAGAGVILLFAAGIFHYVYIIQKG